MERIKATIFLEVAFAIDTTKEPQSNFKVKDKPNILKANFSFSTTITLHLWKV